MADEGDPIVLSQSQGKNRTELLTPSRPSAGAGLRACLRQGTVIRIQPAKQRVPGRKSNGACVGLTSDKEGEFTLADFTSVFGPFFRVPMNRRVAPRKRPARSRAASDAPDRHRAAGARATKP